MSHVVQELSESWWRLIINSNFNLKDMVWANTANSVSRHFIGLSFHNISIPTFNKHKFPQHELLIFVQPYLFLISHYYCLSLLYWKLFNIYFLKKKKPRFFFFSINVVTKKSDKNIYSEAKGKLPVKLIECIKVLLQGDERYQISNQ